MLGSLDEHPQRTVSRNMETWGFQKQKATRMEFQKLVRLEFVRPPCARLLSGEPSRNPANSSSTSQTQGFCWGSLSSSRLQQQHLASHMSAEVHINEMVTTQLAHWQAFILPCETDHETPVENPVSSPPPKELSAPSPAWSSVACCTHRNPFQAVTGHVSAKNMPCSV